MRAVGGPDPQLRLAEADRHQAGGRDVGLQAGQVDGDERALEREVRVADDEVGDVEVEAAAYGEDLELESDRLVVELHRSPYLHRSRRERVGLVRVDGLLPVERQRTTAATVHLDGKPGHRCGERVAGQLQLGGQVHGLDGDPAPRVGRRRRGRDGRRARRQRGEPDRAVRDPDAEAVGAYGQEARLGIVSVGLVQRERDREQVGVVEVAVRGGVERAVGVDVHVDDLADELEAGGAGDEAEDVEVAQLARDRQDALGQRQRDVVDLDRRRREAVAGGLVGIHVVGPVDGSRVDGRRRRARAVGVIGAGRLVDLDPDPADARPDARQRERGGEVAGLHDGPRAVVGRACRRRRRLRLQDGDVHGAVGDDDAEAGDADGQAARLGRLGGRLVERDRDGQQGRVVEVRSGSGVRVGVDRVLAEREARGAGQQPEDVELAQLALDLEAALRERQGDVHDLDGRRRERAGLVRVDARDPVDRGRELRLLGGAGAVGVERAGRAVDLDADVGDDRRDTGQRERGGEPGGLHGDPRARVGRAGGRRRLRRDRREPNLAVPQRDAEAGGTDGDEAGLGQLRGGLVERQADRQHRGVVEVGRVEVAVVGERDVDGVGGELEVDRADEEAEQVDRRAGGGDLEDALLVRDRVVDVAGVDDVDGVRDAVVVDVDVLGPVERGRLRRAGRGVGTLVEQHRELLDLELEPGDPLERGAGHGAADGAPALRRRNGAGGDDAGEVQRPALDAESDPAGTDEGLAERDRDLREVGVVEVAGAAERAAVEVDVGGGGLVGDGAGAGDEAEEVELGDGGRNPRDPRAQRQLVDRIVGLDDVDRASNPSPLGGRQRRRRHRAVDRLLSLTWIVPTFSTSPSIPFSEPLVSDDSIVRQLLVPDTIEAT